MTVWVFGDSFAHQYQGLKDQWMQQVANNLEQELKTFGLSGSSTEYTYQKFNSVRDQIKENDIVIIALTTHSRRWFFKNFPGVTTKPDKETQGFTSSMYSPTGNPKEKEALQYYAEYLHYSEPYEVYLYNFLYNLNALTKKLNLHTLVLVNFWDTNDWIQDKKDLFPNIHFSLGMMLVVNIEEFTKQYVTKVDVSKPDRRVNHMTKSNHFILADKILNNIKNNAPVDLTIGFLKHMVDENSFRDKEFLKNELFNIKF